MKLAKVSVPCLLETTISIAPMCQSTCHVRGHVHRRRHWKSHQFVYTPMLHAICVEEIVKPGIYGLMHFLCYAACTLNTTIKMASILKQVCCIPDQARSRLRSALQRWAKASVTCCTIFVRGDFNHPTPGQTPLFHLASRLVAIRSMIYTRGRKG